ncbi:uncharacterized protein Z518_02825 [Rhinocladiella mackenziei CBS 650.93]|uniref:Uncharacterized protein n=1 Tax=Rhinocladiella mackenziei CBS 650.93 TaxID=1442369 RepID=A0A0D2IQG0_9EURO|nr:uncharacterized protein Z518_02825 [Rhinocladiella mackenziei CBS 650.93]KIX08169.1 hypothetical protein Z518_02825 [Rhinocladiella mackenziei CBS 650.93]
MFREPEEIAADQAAAKLDQIAATRRSTIRRESTARPGRYSSSRSLIDRIRDSRREIAHEQRNTTFPSRQQREAEREFFDLDAELERLRSLRQRHRARTNQLDRELARRNNNDHIPPEPEPRHDLDLELLSRLRANVGHVSLDDVNSNFGIEVLLSDSHDTIAQHLPRPSRESGLRFEVAATPQSESEPPRRTRFHSARATRVSSPAGGTRVGIAGSPWSLAVQRAGFDDGDDDDNENATLTPGFAPAHGAFRAASQPLDDRSRRSEANPGDGLMDTPPPESLEASYPPLRRVSHMSPRPLGVSGSRVDGLGDRLRSPSPTSDTPEEENWATLLNTMEPGRSSTATSFLSSRPDSRSGSNRSSQATTVATSFGEIGADDSCDLDLPSGITEEQVRQIRERHGRLRREPVPRPDESVPEAIQRDLARGNERMLELEVFGVILERMQRREEIPDEWWAAVGLSPDVVRGSA